MRHIKCIVSAMQNLDFSKDVKTEGRGDKRGQWLMKVMTVHYVYEEHYCNDSYTHERIEQEKQIGPSHSHCILCGTEDRSYSEKFTIYYCFLFLSFSV